jgi:hypothetical protein
MVSSDRLWDSFLYQVNEHWCLCPWNAPGFYWEFVILASVPYCEPLTVWYKDWRFVSKTVMDVLKWQLRKFCEKVYILCIYHPIFGYTHSHIIHIHSRIHNYLFSIKSTSTDVCAPERHQDSTGNLSSWQAFRIVNPLLSDTRIGVLYLKPFGVCGCSAMYISWAQTSVLVDLIEKRISKAITRHHHIIIYLWSGTCDAGSIIFFVVNVNSFSRQTVSTGKSIFVGF